MKKTMILFFSCFLSMILFAGIASAHIVVYPQQTTQGTYEKFTVRVPSEQDIPTVKIEVKIPADVAISRFEPKTGWKYDLTKDASGKIASVVWTTTENGLSKTEFGEFNMQGKVSDTATAITWETYQTYKDGSVVEWVGAEGTDKPASITKVNPKTSSGAEATPATTNSNLSLYFSIASLIIALLALLISLKKKAK